ncbi:MAG: DNA polymerase III subunit gamma/tau [Desulfobulbus sp.]|nr:DNA polymerase III subunit gamma/tau [Desulfobulbus sp.]
MSYLVLARKSRPQIFAQVVGQQTVVRTLQNGLTQGRVAHALLFSGVRGTGKTTLARIMAKALNCEQGPASEPCNRCRSCREITDGASVDLQEVDGASNRGIQEIRELKEKIRFLPTSSRYKIIIIDEVHMLTTEAFNALLKTLEEPPAHVYFMFATTEPHKVPLTILSRCQRYELKRLGHQELANHFNRLAAEEGVQVEPEAMDMIVREASGSVRDGLSLLDQIFSYCGQQVTATEVVDVLGLVSHRLLAELGTALLAGDLDTVYRLLDDIYRHGTDIRRFGNDLLAWFRGLIVCKVSRKPADLLAVTDEELEVLQNVAASQGIDALTATLHLLMEGVEKVGSSQHPRLAFELACIEAARFGDVVGVAELVDRFNHILAGQPDPVPPPSVQEPTSVSSLAPTTASAPPHRPVTAKPSPEPERKAADQTKAPESETDREETPRPPEAAPTATTPAPPSEPAPLQAQAKERAEAESPTVTPAAVSISKRKVRQHWDAFLRYVHERQRWMAAALQLSTSVKQQDGTLVIRFEDSADCLLLQQREHVHTLTEFVLDFFQDNLKIHYEIPGAVACEINPANGLAPQQERRALANDPLVQTALDVFSGQVGDIRIGPRYRKNTRAKAAEAQDSPEE